MPARRQPATVTFASSNANTNLQTVTANSITLTAGNSSLSATAPARISPRAITVEGRREKPGRLTPEKNLNVSIDSNGKIHPMNTTGVLSYLLLISEPAFMDFTSGTELVPISVVNGDSFSVSAGR